MGKSWKYYNADEFNNRKRLLGKNFRAPPTANVLAAANHIKNVFDAKKVNWAAMGALVIFCLGSRRELSDVHIVYDDRDFEKLHKKLDADKRVRLPNGMNALFPAKILVGTGPNYQDGCAENAEVEVNLIPPGFYGTPPSDVFKRHQVLLRLESNGKTNNYKALDMLYQLKTTIQLCKLRDLTWDPKNDIVSLCQGYGHQIATFRPQLNMKELEDVFFSTPYYPRLSPDYQSKCAISLLGKEWIPTNQPTSITLAPEGPSVMVTSPPNAQVNAIIAQSQKPSLAPYQSTSKLHHSYASSTYMNISELGASNVPSQGRPASADSISKHTTYGSSTSQPAVPPANSPGRDARSRYRSMNSTQSSRNHSRNTNRDLSPQTHPNNAGSSSNGSWLPFKQLPSAANDTIPDVSPNSSRPRNISTQATVPMAATAIGHHAPKTKISLSAAHLSEAPVPIYSHKASSSQNMDQPPQATGLRVVGPEGLYASTHEPTPSQPINGPGGLGRNDISMSAAKSNILFAAELPADQNRIMQSNTKPHQDFQKVDTIMEQHTNNSRTAAMYREPPYNGMQMQYQPSFNAAPPVGNHLEQPLFNAGPQPSQNPTQAKKMLPITPPAVTRSLSVPLDSLPTSLIAGGSSLRRRTPTPPRTRGPQETQAMPTQVPQYASASLYAGAGRASQGPSAQAVAYQAFPGRVYWSSSPQGSTGLVHAFTRPPYDNPYAQAEHPSATMLEELQQSFPVLQIAPQLPPTLPKQHVAASIVANDAALAYAAYNTALALQEPMYVAPLKTKPDTKGKTLNVFPNELAKATNVDAVVSGFTASGQPEIVKGTCTAYSTEASPEKASGTHKFVETTSTPPLPKTTAEHRNITDFNCIASPPTKTDAVNTPCSGSSNPSSAEPANALPKSVQLRHTLPPLSPPKPLHKPVEPIPLSAQSQYSATPKVTPLSTSARDGAALAEANAYSKLASNPFLVFHKQQVEEEQALRNMERSMTVKKHDGEFEWEDAQPGMSDEKGPREWGVEEEKALKELMKNAGFASRIRKA